MHRPSRDRRAGVTANREPPRDPQPGPASATPALHATSLRVIGIGGSAGGIAPCTELLSALPASGNLVVIVVMHLSPSHESGLAALFARSATMPVTEAKEGDLLAPGHVYVIPPRAALVVRNGRLHLEPRSSRREPPSVIDRLFASLAACYKGQSVGVVLSGSGSDGTLGLRAIRAVGGHTFAQDLETAEQHGMPASAVGAGVVERVLPPDAIGKALGQPVLEVAVPEAPNEPGEAVHDAATLEAIISQLSTATGANFTHYKRPTLLRRIARRLDQLHIVRPDEYLDLLRRDPGEVNALQGEVLIQVTEFFRDPGALEHLSSVLQPMLRDRTDTGPLRIWVAGCASGEEAYSVAMVALEAAEAAERPVSLQVFATDLSESALETARIGRYPAEVTAKIGPERLDRYFKAVEGGVEIDKRLRAMCVFARHDLTRDPPFSRLDLVVCRNVFIYLDSTLQQRVLRTFHYALKPSGYLMLGPAETTTLARDLFVSCDQKHRLYQSGGTRTDLPPLDLLARRVPAIPRAGAGSEPGAPPEGRGISALERIAEQAYRLERPSARIITNRELDVIHMQGATGEYLEEPSGEPTARLLKLVRQPLRAPLGRLVSQAFRTGARAEKAGVRLTGGRVAAVDLVVVPLGPDPADAVHCLILFEPRTVGATGPRNSARVTEENGSENRVTELMDELQETREYLESVIEVHETTQAELQAAYEESLSSNEEFQSTNEELETTKEELQSMNEEITTLNDELQRRNGELNQSLADLTNIFGSIDTPVVLVDSELRLRRFSPAAVRVFDLTTDSVGQSLRTMSWGIAPAGLVDLCQDVIRGGAVRQQEIEDPQGHGFLFRISPYRVEGEAITGAVLVLLDVDLVHQLLRLSEIARQHSDAIIQSVGQPLLVLDHQARIHRANKAFYRTFLLSPDEVEGRTIYEIMDGEWDFPSLREVIEGARTGLRTVELTHTFQRVGRRGLFVSAQQMVEPGRQDLSVLLAIEDLTDRRRIETYMQQVAKAEAIGTLAGGVAHDLNNQLTAMLGCLEMIDSEDESPAERVRDLLEVRSAAGKMAAMTRQLLAYGRRQLLTPAPLELNGFLAIEENVLRRVIGPRVTLTVQRHPNPLWLLIDQMQLEQVLLNLAVNARDAMPDGGRLEIAALPVVIDDEYRRRHGATGAADGPYVRLRVADTGTGMTEEVRSRAFEPFFTTKEVGRGTGLGLASVYGVVKQSEGWIWLESSPGNGATFLLDFPARVAPVGSPHAAPVPHPAG